MRCFWRELTGAPPVPTAAPQNKSLWLRLALFSPLLVSVFFLLAPGGRFQMVVGAARPADRRISSCLRRGAARFRQHRPLRRH